VQRRRIAAAREVAEGDDPDGPARRVDDGQDVPIGEDAAQRVPPHDQHRPDVCLAHRERGLLDRRGLGECDRIAGHHLAHQ